MPVFIPFDTGNKKIIEIKYYCIKHEVKGRSQKTNLFRINYQKSPIFVEKINYPYSEMEENLIGRSRSKHACDR